MTLDQLQRLVDGIETQGLVDTWLWMSAGVFAGHMAKDSPKEVYDELLIHTRLPLVMGGILGWYARELGFALFSNDPPPPESMEAELDQLESITHQLPERARSNRALSGATV